MKTRNKKENVLAFYCSAISHHKFSLLKPNTFIILNFPWVMSPGMTLLDPLLGVSWVCSQHVSGLYSHLEVNWRIHLFLWQNLFHCGCVTEDLCFLLTVSWRSPTIPRNHFIESARRIFQLMEFSAILSRAFILLGQATEDDLPFE